MNKRYKVMKKLIVLSLILLSLTSCVTKSPYIKDHPEFTEDGAPYWTVLTPLDKWRFYGVGMGELSNPVNSKMKAESQARDEIARQVSLMINNAVKNYTNEAGLRGNTQELSVFETISIQVANTTLRNVIVENVYHDPNSNAVWVIASYEKKYLESAYKAEAENLKRDLEKRKIAAIEALAVAKERADQALEVINKTNSENKNQQIASLEEAYNNILEEKNKEIESLENQLSSMNVEKMVQNLSTIINN